MECCVFRDTTLLLALIAIYVYDLSTTQSGEHYMKAWVIREAGGPEQFNLEDVKTPEPKKGWALIRIHAFGLNRSEWFTRKGDSPSVLFP